jgi:Tfp pilus assembly protein PilV
MEQQEFKVAGLVTLVIVCLGIIMLALIAKRLRRLRKVVGARKRRQAADSMANEFDEFFE